MLSVKFEAIWVRIYIDIHEKLQISGLVGSEYSAYVLKNENDKSNPSNIGIHTLPVMCRFGIWW